MNRNIKLAIDVDDVLCETNQKFLDHINAKESTSYVIEDIKTYDFAFLSNEVSIRKRYIKMIIDLINTDCLVMPARDNIKEVLQFFKILNIEMFVITARENTVKTLTERWIKNNVGFDISVTIENKNKGKVAKEKGVTHMIDDSPDNIKSAIENGITPIVFDRPWNRNLPKNIKRVYSWLEIKDYITK